MEWIWIPLGILLLLMLAPKIGFLAQARTWHSLRQRVQVEDALKHLVSRRHRGLQATTNSLAGALGRSQKRVVKLVLGMEARGLLRATGGGLQLTDEGARWGLHVIRAHRLWERYLSDEAGVPLTQLHRAAERAEHRLSADEVDALDAHLGHPVHDPHGHPIPAPDGHLAESETVPLTNWPLATPAFIARVNDRPEVIFEQIMAEDLRPGRVVRVLELTDERITVADGENEVRLAPAVASSIRVTSPPMDVAPVEGSMPLSDLPDGADAEITALDPDLRGFGRRRLLDLGLTPGTRVQAALSTFVGDPRAYRVRSTLIGLRRSQADQIWVRPLPAADTKRSGHGDT